MTVHSTSVQLKGRFQFFFDQTFLTAFDPYIAPYTTRALFVLLLVLLNKLPLALYSTNTSY